MLHAAIREYIKEKGIKQTAIANGIGISVSRLHQYLSGRSKMPAEVFMAICKFVGVSPEYFENTKAST